jgi:crotonobetainyl-CoA:carnitine CoA-transferase CaiB-like acyl-CoA transferase
MSLTADNNRLPLSDLRVVALEQAVAAPFCSRQLADMGADVVKIERPNGGDPARAYDSAIRGESAYFAWLNRGKRSVALDLSGETARRVLALLLARADIFVHNLAPGAVERLGFGYDALTATHPRLIWCGISGYGSDGPRRDSKAYDMLVQAESGVVSLTGSPNEPAKVGISIADISAGLYAYSSILTALIQRSATGRGERIDISMLECLTEWVSPPLYVWQGSGRVPARVGVRHNMIVPYGAYACSDGAVLFAVQNGAEWRRFCDLVLRQPDLADDERFSTNARRLTNRAQLEALIEDRFRAYTRAEVMALLAAAALATATVNDIPAVANHPQLAARGRWTRVASPSGEIPALVPPHNLMSAPPRMGAVPALGEHTNAVLTELGVELEPHENVT